MREKSFPSVFNSRGSYERFNEHLGEASTFVRIGAITALTLRRIFGAGLTKIPVLSKLNGPIMALAAMHNFELPSSTGRGATVQQLACEFDARARWDLVVAGSGPGGAITASKASESGESVLVVEMGTWIDSEVPHHTPEQMRRFFRFGGQEVAISLSPLPFAQGMTVGGGSEINSGLYHRLPESVLPDWLSRLGDIGPIDYEDAAAAVENRLFVQKQERSSLGVYENSPIVEIGSHLGWTGGVVPRWRTYEGTRFRHHGMSETYLQDAMSHGAKLLVEHKVTSYSLVGDRVRVELTGKSCKHHIDAATLCLSAGTIGTPEILWRSGTAKAKDFSFGFHAMLREAAVFDRDVNDLHDIDPHQTWSKDAKRKIGAAVGTPQLLASTLATKNVDYDGEFSRVGTYYISTPFIGKSGMIPLGANLVPYFSVDAKMKEELHQCALILRNSLIEVGGQPLGALNSSISTVHIFSSLPLGQNHVLDRYANVLNSDGRVFVRDASILPSAPLVNPQGPLMHLVTMLEAKRRMIAENG